MYSICITIYICTYIYIHSYLGVCVCYACSIIKCYISIKFTSVLIGSTFLRELDYFHFFSFSLSFLSTLFQNTFKLRKQNLRSSDSISICCLPSFALSAYCISNFVDIYEPHPSFPNYFILISSPTTPASSDQILHSF